VGGGGGGGGVVGPVGGCWCARGWVVVGGWTGGRGGGLGCPGAHGGGGGLRRLGGWSEVDRCPGRVAPGGVFEGWVGGRGGVG